MKSKTKWETNKTTDLLQEDLYKLPGEHELEFNERWIEKINNFISRAVPKAKLRIKCGGYFGDSWRHTVVNITEAILLNDDSIGLWAIDPSPRDGSKRRYLLVVDDCFKQRNVVSFKQKLRTEWDRDYLRIELLSPMITKLLNKMAEEKEKLYLEFKQYNRSAAGKAHKRADQLSDEEKAVVKYWFYNNISKIEFLIPMGNLDNAPINNERDAQLVTEIIDHFENEQNKIESWFNLNLTPGLNEKVAENVFVRWRDADGTEETRLSLYKMWAVNTNIYFKELLSTVPEEVKEVLKSAKARSTAYGAKGTYEETATFISSNILGIEIINELFDRDLNFLAGPAPAKPAKEPKHELDLDFANVDAYGDEAA